MSLSVSLLGGEGSGSVVSEEHFGLNFVADYERIGSKPWERFDDVALRLGTTSIRYPGGVAAEQVFDYRNPNLSQIILKDGEKINFTPLSQYLDYCNTNKIDPTIIIPASQLLADARIANHRTFDTAQSDALKDFIHYVISSVDPSLKISFEIGNEYEGYMTSTEYGRLANSIALIIQEATEEAQPLNEPDVFVQVWGYSVGGGLTPDELATRNLQVISQFSAESLAVIDGVVSHFYYHDGRNPGSQNEQNLQNIATQIERIADLQAAWELASGRDLDFRVSEWNVSFRSETDLGLRQIIPLMEMFTSFLRSGFDELDFWSAQYHRTSAADASGRLMVAGTMLDLLTENTLGLQVGDVSHFEDYSVYSFISDDRQVTFLASSTTDRVSIDLSTSDLPPGFELLGGYIVGVNELTADGAFKGLTNLPAYAEPDAAVTLANVPMSVVIGASNSITLDPFECLVLVFQQTETGRANVYGSDGSDWLYGLGTPASYIGGSGYDTVNYITSSTAINVRLDSGFGAEEYQGDIFFSIESVLGSNFDDKIVGTSNSEVIGGGGGNDSLYGERGNDTLLGFSGNDLLFGGPGNDELRGGDGDDVMSGGGGSDTVFGDSGDDTLSFDDFSSAVTFWVEEGVAETDWGNVRFFGIERFVGTDFNDRFVLDGVGTVVFAGQGDDSAQVRGDGYHVLHFGAGDDVAQVYSAGVEFFGGDGRDRLVAFASAGVFNGGDGDDRVSVTGNSWVFEGGKGSDVITVKGSGNKFVFSGENGHDWIDGFDLEKDEIIFKGAGCADAVVSHDDDGTLIQFSADSSIFLLGVSLVDLSCVDWWPA